MPFFQNSFYAQVHILFGISKLCAVIFSSAFRIPEILKQFHTDKV